MLKIHDNEIASYEVDLKNQKIILYTEYHGSKLIERINIVFCDVLVHFFDNELSASIILDIEEYSINQFINDNSELLEQKRNYCWPMDYKSIKELTEKLIKEQYSYYVISSSYGLNGWILAKNYKTIS